MKKIIKLTESDLTRIVKRVIKEQNEKPIAVKQLEKDGYDVEVGSLPLSNYKKNTLMDNGISSVGETDSASRMTFIELLKKNNINKNNIKSGFTVKRKLDNGNIEYRWIKIVG